MVMHTVSRSQGPVVPNLRGGGSAKVISNISQHPLDCNSQTVNIYKGFAEEDESGSVNKVVVMVTDQNSAAVTVTCVI